MMTKTNKSNYIWVKCVHCTVVGGEQRCTGPADKNCDEVG